MAPGKAHFLIGPTGVGKTDVGHLLALELGRNVLSADSMLIYRGMDIGTAKPDSRRRAEVRYLGLDLVDPQQPFSVGDYMRHATEALGSADAPSEPIVVGGTGLYVKCLTEGLHDDPPPDEATRNWAAALIEREGLAAFARIFEERYAEAYAAVTDPQNPRRLIRAYERAAGGGGSPVAWVAPPAPLIGLRLERTVLYERIERRVQAMYAAGLLDEVATLRDRYGQLSTTAAKAIGYAEALACLEGRWTREEAMTVTALRTRKLAKRQMTWFRNQAHVVWVEAAENDSPEQLAKQVRHLWEQHGPVDIVA